MGESEVLVGQRRRLAAAGRALEEALLDQERLVDLLDRPGLFAHGRGHGVQTHGTAVEFLDDRSENLVVHLVQSARVDVQRREGDARDFQVDVPFALDHCEVAHAAQQGVGDTRRAARTQGHFVGRVVVDRDVEDARRASHDAREHRGVVVFEVALDAETRPEGRSQQAAARCGADEREGRQLDLDRAGRGAFVQHDVDFIVLHRRVEILLDDRAEAVDLVDEKHVARIEVGQQARQVARLVEHRTRRDAQLRPHFVGDDVREGRLAQSRGAVQQDVVERVAAHERRLDEDMEVFDDLVLPGEGFQLLRADFVLEFEIALRVAYD